MSRGRPVVLTAACALALLLVLVSGGLAGAAQNPSPLETGGVNHVPESVPLKEALVSLPVAALLGASLAFRPQRRGTPPRNSAVIQTQIILSMVGALVMLVVGASLARAFGIVGAASLVRYRAKVDDPKDAGVMLSCLGLGLAAGVGIYWVAAVSAGLILAVLWILESSEPKVRKDFVLKVKAKDSAGLRGPIEDLLHRHKLAHELRASSADDVTYAVKLPLSKKTDQLTNEILSLGSPDGTAVEWSEKKGKEKT